MKELRSTVSEASGLIERGELLLCWIFFFILGIFGSNSKEAKGISLKRWREGSPI